MLIHVLLTTKVHFREQAHILKIAKNILIFAKSHKISAICECENWNCGSENK